MLVYLHAIQKLLHAGEGARLHASPSWWLILSSGSATGLQYRTAVEYNEAFGESGLFAKAKYF